MEAALFAAEGPLGLAEMAELLGEGVAIRARRWQRLARGLCGARHPASSSGAGSGISRRRPTSPISCAASGRGPRRLSRARRCETLAIIAYHEPVSRADIEAVARRADFEGHARRADGGGLGAPGRPARGAGAAAALCDDAGVPRSFRPRPRAATCRGSTNCSASGLLDPLEDAFTPLHRRRGGTG